MSYYDKPDAKIADLLGETIVKVEGEAGDNTLTLELKNGKKFHMYHSQDCCESVSIEDICGDMKDLIDLPLLMAEEVSSENEPAPPNADSYTWTFYKLGTVKGAVTIRWLGESNGYYSESVDSVWL